MILPDSEVASLETALGCWEWFGYISTGVVALGCIGEFVAEFTSLPRSDTHKHKLARLSLMILILGIAGELLSAVRTSQLSGQIIANIEERAANAEQKAGEANDRAAANEKESAQLHKDAEGLKAENLRLEAIVQPRTISLLARQALADKLRQFALSFKGRKVKLASQVGDAEGLVFATEIHDILHRAGIDVDPSGVARQEWVGTVYFGAKITGPANDAEFIKALTYGLRDGIGSDGVDAEAGDKYAETVVTVGVKPILGLPKQWLRKTPP